MLHPYMAMIHPNMDILRLTSTISHNHQYMKTKNNMISELNCNEKDLEDSYVFMYVEKYDEVRCGSM